MGTEGVDLAIFIAYLSFISRSSSGGAGALGDFPILHYFRNFEIKNTGLAFFLVLTGHIY